MGVETLLAQIWFCLSTGYDFLKGVIEVALGTFTEPVMTGTIVRVFISCLKETEKLKKMLF